jgi:hypothetical protein
MRRRFEQFLLGEKTFPFVATAVTLLLFTAFTLACAPSETTRNISRPVSSWNDNFIYAYDPPQNSGVNSVKVTLAVVNPYYPEQSINKDFKKVAKGLAKSFATDLDKIIVARGMTVTGSFDSLDMMTYPDKKNSDLSLTPEFLIEVQTRDLTRWTMKQGSAEKEVEVKLYGAVILVLREPLSSEKIWIKKIPVDELVERATIIAQAVPVYITSTVIPDSYQIGNVEFDGSQDAVANMLKKIYPSMMDTVWRYLEPEELVMLKEKGKEIRVLKRY